MNVEINSLDNLRPSLVTEANVVHRNSSVNKAYDAISQRVAMIDPDGGRFSYHYNAARSLAILVNPQSDRTSYSYDAAGRRTLKQLSNGTRESLVHDNADRLTALYNLKSDSTVISSFEYRYDNVGNRTRVVEANGDRVTWNYDDTYQLTNEMRSGANAYNTTFIYDAVGNREVEIADASRTTTAFDSANQIKVSVNGSGRTTYTFDANGNQRIVLEPNSDRSTTAWNYENQPTVYTLPTTERVSMVYNPNNLRVQKQNTSGTTKFIWDHRNYLLETDVNDITTVVYTNAPRDAVVSLRHANTTKWARFDGIGSVREFTDSTELVTSTFLSDSWGNAVHQSGQSISSLRWMGRFGYYYDSERDAYYVRLRTYEPRVARWIQVDTLWHVFLREGKYTYVLNNPVTRHDPSGRCSQGIPTAGIGIFYAPDRGRFTQVTSGAQYEPMGVTEPSNVSDVGSNIQINWRPNHDSFRGVPFAGSCCCCDRAGFVQMIETEQISWPLDFNRDSHIDRGVPYPIPNNGPKQVCPKPESNAIVSMTDDPGHGTYLLVLLNQVAEACVVCLKGRESANKPFPYSDLSDRPPVFIYGCVKWSHTFAYDSDRDGFLASRTIGEVPDMEASTNQLAPSDENVQLILAMPGANDYSGSKPSDRFAKKLSEYYGFDIPVGF